MLVCAEILLIIASFYWAIGLIFAIAFVTAGVRVVDPASNGSGIAFRLIILPGVAALWPLLLSRWIARRRA